MSATTACIFGCEGTALGQGERDFFAETAPWGFILFARNIVTPDQVRRLTGDLRDAVGREARVRGREALVQARDALRAQRLGCAVFPPFTYHRRQFAVLLQRYCEQLSARWTIPKALKCSTNP